MNMKGESIDSLMERMFHVFNDVYMLFEISKTFEIFTSWGDYCQILGILPGPEAQIRTKPQPTEFLHYH